MARNPFPFNVGPERKRDFPTTFILVASMMIFGLGSLLMVYQIITEQDTDDSATPAAVQDSLGTGNAADSHDYILGETVPTEQDTTQNQDTIQSRTAVNQMLALGGGMTVIYLRPLLGFIFAVGAWALWSWRAWGITIMWLVTLTTGGVELYSGISVLGWPILLAITGWMSVYLFRKRAFFD